MYTFNELEKYLDTIPNKEKTPGGSIRVFHHGKEVFAHSFGYADREKGIKMTGDEYYFMYSATKPLTCATASPRAISALATGFILLLFVTLATIFPFSSRITHFV